MSNQNLEIDEKSKLEEIYKSNEFLLLNFIIFIILNSLGIYNLIMFIRIKDWSINEEFYTGKKNINELIIDSVFIQITFYASYIISLFQIIFFSLKIHKHYFPIGLSTYNWGFIFTILFFIFYKNNLEYRQINNTSVKHHNNENNIIINDFNADISNLIFGILFLKVIFILSSIYINNKIKSKKIFYISNIFYKELFGLFIIYNIFGFCIILGPVLFMIGFFIIFGCNCEPGKEGEFKCKLCSPYDVIINLKSFFDGVAINNNKEKNNEIV